MADVHNGIKYYSGLLDELALISGVDRATAGGVERLGETLTPVLNPYELVEFAKLRNEQFFAVQAFVVAVVAEFSISALHNPAGSRMLAVVDKITIGAGVTEAATIDAAPNGGLVDLTLNVGAGVLASVDRRFLVGQAATSRVLLRQGSDAASSFAGDAILEQVSAQAVSTNPFGESKVAVPAVLRPGDLLAVIGLTANTNLLVNWRWRERPALPGELDRG